MVAIVSQHPDLLFLKAERLYHGETLCICLSDEALTADSTPSVIFSSELLETEGYGRVSEVIDGESATYDPAAKEISITQVSATFVASGGVMQWQSAFAVLGGTTKASSSFVAADVDPGTDQVIISNHGLANGDRVIITVEETGSMPGGILSSTIYYAEVVDGKTVRFHANSLLGNVVDITNTGSGTMYLRYCNGRIAAIVQESESIQLLDGQSYTYNIFLKEGV